MSEFGDNRFNPEEFSIERAYELLGLNHDADVHQIEQAYAALEKQKYKGQSGEGRLVSENELAELKKARDIALKDFYGEDTKELDPNFPSSVMK